MVSSGVLPKNMKAGSAITTIGYTANGEATDWFYADKGIYSLSPELGTNDNFFIKNSNEIHKIVQSNY